MGVIGNSTVRKMTVKIKSVMSALTVNEDAGMPSSAAIAFLDGGDVGGGVAVVGDFGRSDVVVGEGEARGARGGAGEGDDLGGALAIDLDIAGGDVGGALKESRLLSSSRPLPDLLMQPAPVTSALMIMSLAAPPG